MAEEVPKVSGKGYGKVYLPPKGVPYRRYLRQVPVVPYTDLFVLHPPTALLLTRISLLVYLLPPKGVPKVPMVPYMVKAIDMVGFSIGGAGLFRYLLYHRYLRYVWCTPHFMLLIFFVQRRYMGYHRYLRNPLWGHIMDSPCLLYHQRT